MEGRNRPSRHDLPVARLLTPCQAPGAPAVRPQSFGNGATRQPGKLSDRAYPELLELLVAGRVERQELQRQRGQERLRPVVGDDQRLTGPGDARCRQRGEPSLRRPRPRLPRRPDRGERPPERRLQPAVQPFHSSRVEVDDTGAVRLDRESGILEPPQDLLPRLFGRGRVLLDQLERRAGRERLREAHPGTDPGSFGGPRHRAEQRLRARQRRKRRRSCLYPRPVAERRPQIEGRDDDESDHGNVCSTRTHVPLSRVPAGLPYPPSRMARRDPLPQLEGELFITDGGMETTLIFHHGVDLPHFASFDLLKDDDGRRLLRDYYGEYVSLAREQGVGLLLDTPTWRANRDWGEQLGYSEEALEQVNLDAVRLVDELRGDGAPPILVSGAIGPRGDGYQAANRMTTAVAERYHARQIETLASGGADLVSVLTMTYAEEAAGTVRAAAAAGIPVSVSFTVETDGACRAARPCAMRSSRSMRRRTTPPPTS